VSFLRWFLPLGIYSPFAHTPRRSWQSVCGMWDLSRPGVITNDVGRPKCPECLAVVEDENLVEAGASHASGENRTPERAPSGPVVGASPLATPRKVKP
jgi:hypothetical protein